jgi:branched-chain amino acid transport system substrate-binding protein
MTLKSVESMLTSTLLGLATVAAHAQFAGDVVKIGFMTDLSGVFADVDGTGGVEAIRMAIADRGGMVRGRKIELIVADHQNAPDVAATRAREWFDTRGLSMLLGGPNSSVSLALAKVSADKKRPFIAVGAGTSALTNEQCSPYTVHYAYDTIALARGIAPGLVKAGGKTWFFISSDNAYGASLQREGTAAIEATGGSVLGSIKHPLAAADFSSFLIKAQSSKAQILALADAGNDMVNVIKTANEFSVSKTMKIAPFSLLINDVHSLGLKVTQGMFVTDGWYWAQSPQSIAWSKRFFEKVKKMPTSLQAADYSAVANYLDAVDAADSDSSDKVMARMRGRPINDMFAKGGFIRPDGRMVHDMFLFQVKSPSESNSPWDYYKLVATTKGEQAFTQKSESKCDLWK